MTTDSKTAARRAYHAAEGDVTDVKGHIDLFVDGSVFHAGQSR